MFGATVGANAFTQVFKIESTDPLHALAQTAAFI